MPSSLDKVLKAGPVPLPLDTVRQVMRDFLRALEYLHGRGICHRDIKPHNLLVDLARDTAEVHVKLCDFGCSKRLVAGEPNIQYICARYYRAPEIAFGWAHYSTAIDLWSAGCVMAELFTGAPLFPGKNSIDQLARIIKVLGPPSREELAAMGQDPRRFKAGAAWGAAERAASLGERTGLVDGDAVDLLRRLLQYDPAGRITAVEALAHPFLSGTRAPAIGKDVGDIQTHHPVPPATASNSSVHEERTL